MAKALVAARLFDGERMREGEAVVIEDGRIAGVVAAGALGSGVERIDLGGGFLAPGFVDVQVNGGGGTLLNGEPTLEGVRRIAGAHRRFGTTALLATVITDAQPVLEAAAAAVGAAIADKVPGVVGIHIEGPFLDPRRKGAHRADLIRTMTGADADWLLGLDCGIVMVTVAPEAASPALIRRLAQGGVLVSLGHSDCSAGEAQAAFGAGARGVTHLYNAMSQLGHRQPGLVGAALADRSSWCGLIADGHHVDPLALGIAIAAKRRGRTMLVSDAMPTAAGGPDSFALQGREVRRTGSRLELADGTLAGSDITLDAAVRYCVSALGLDRAEALRMASLYPARFLGRCDIGLLAPGCRADLVHLDDAGQVLGTWVDGHAW